MLDESDCHAFNDSVEMGFVVGGVENVAVTDHEERGALAVGIPAAYSPSPLEGEGAGG